MVRILPLVAAMLCCACTTTYYQGRTQLPYLDGTERDVAIYWQRSDYLIGKPKAGPATVVMTCGNNIQYVETENDGIAFRGEPGSYRFMNDGQPLTSISVCGRLEDYDDFTSIEGLDAVNLTLKCERIFDAFATAPTFIQPSESPYTFPIDTSAHRWFISPPDVPVPEVACD